jgi:hypothetical protein
MYRNTLFLQGFDFFLHDRWQVAEINDDVFPIDPKAEQIGRLTQSIEIAGQEIVGGQGLYHAGCLLGFFQTLNHATTKSQHNQRTSITTSEGKRL